MRTTLVQPPLNNDPGKPSFPLGLLSIAAVLEQNNFEVRVVDFDLSLKCEALEPGTTFVERALREIDWAATDVLGISCMSCNFHLGLELAEAFKTRRPDAMVIFGGPHVSFLAAEVLKRFDFIDVVVIGEAEVTVAELWPKLAARDGLENIAGICFRQAGTVQVSSHRSTIDDLDILPVPAYHLVPVQKYLEFEAIAWLEVGRGCPFPCNFCSTAPFWARKYRVKSAARVIQEATFLERRHGIRETNFLHDNLTVRKDYLHSLCDLMVQAGCKVKWYCTSRADHLESQTIERMAASGCVDIFFGIESMNSERQRWIKKNLMPDKVRSTLAEVCHSGIKPSLGFITGFPDESDAETDETFEYALKMKLTHGVHILISYLQLYPGAPLYDSASFTLRPSSIAAANNSIVPGHRVRKDLVRRNPRLFPTLCSTMSDDALSRVISKRNLLDALINHHPKELAELASQSTISSLLKMMERQAGPFLEAGGTLAMREQVATTLRRCAPCLQQDRTASTQ